MRSNLCKARPVGNSALPVRRNATEERLRNLKIICGAAQVRTTLLASRLQSRALMFVDKGNDDSDEF